MYNCDGLGHFNSALFKAAPTKQGCTGCLISEQPYLYSYRPKVFREISQADANSAKAQADMVPNGQNYVNTNGICYAPPIFRKNVFDKILPAILVTL